MIRLSEALTIDHVILSTMFMSVLSKEPALKIRKPLVTTVHNLVLLVCRLESLSYHLLRVWGSLSTSLRHTGDSSEGSRAGRDDLLIYFIFFFFTWTVESLETL